MPTTYFTFHAPINPVTTQNLMAAVAQRMMNGTDDFYFLLSTPGGSVASGLTLYNFLRGLPFPKTMHNIGNVDSIGNAVFLAGDTRYACAHSTFMFHGVGFDVQNMRVEEKNARELLTGILSDQKRIGEILVARTGVTANEARKLFREASTKDASHALAAGLVSDVRDVQVPVGADIVSLVL